jgi:hypothetical protein
MWVCFNPHRNSNTFIAIKRICYVVVSDKELEDPYTLLFDAGCTSLTPPVIPFLNPEMLFSKAKFSNQISGTGYHLNLEPPIDSAIGLFFMSMLS